METISLITAILASMLALCALIVISTLKTQLFEVESDLLDVASRSRSMRYDINLLMSSKQDKSISIKRKRGRPKKQE